MYNVQCAMMGKTTKDGRKLWLCVNSTLHIPHSTLIRGLGYEKDFGVRGFYQYL